MLLAIKIAMVPSGAIPCRMFFRTKLQVCAPVMPFAVEHGL